MLTDGWHHRVERSRKKSESVLTDLAVGGCKGQLELGGSSFHQSGLATG